MSKTIGVIGLGIIGSVWARHYADAGKLVAAWNRTPQPEFPAWTATPAEVARRADVIQIVVADPVAVRAILAEIAPMLGAGKIVVQSSTIDPASSEEFAQIVQHRGARYLEAPFSGSRPAAEQKLSVFFLGGDATLIAEVEPLLALVSAHRFVLGTAAQAAAFKLATNLNAAAQMLALSEALTMARRAGIADETFFTVLAKLVSYSPLAKLKEPKLRAGDFTPQFSVKHMHKDMRLAATMAGCADFPVLDALRETLKTAEARGLGDEDFSAVIKLLDQG
jgi:3-hydroxyisobutyrate dehydrogenase-like beta-hydroxyacid dehydrogenase